MSTVITIKHFPRVLHQNLSTRDTAMLKLMPRQGDYTIIRQSTCVFPVPSMEFITDFFTSLPDTLQYAIERGLEDITQPCKGDLDILIRKSDFPVLLDTARKSGLLVCVSVTFGGARMFLGPDNSNLKRIDLDWSIHYRGLVWQPADHYLRERLRDPESGLFVLPTRQHAEILHFIKNCYSGAHRYNDFLKQQGFGILDRTSRAHLLLETIRRRPLQTLTGKLRYLVCYLMRTFHPTGLVVTGATRETLLSLPQISYIFQGRIDCCGLLAALAGSIYTSRLCIIKSSSIYNIDLGGSPDILLIRKLIIGYLRSNRSRLPGGIFTIA